MKVFVRSIHAFPVATSGKVFVGGRAKEITLLRSPLVQIRQPRLMFGGSILSFQVLMTSECTTTFFFHHPCHMSWTFLAFFFLHVFCANRWGGFGNFRTIQPRNFNSPIAFRTLSSLTLLGQTNACELSFPNAGSRGLQAFSRVFHASSGNSSYNGAEPGIWVWVASGVFAPRPNLITTYSCQDSCGEKGFVQKRILAVRFYKYAFE